MTFVQLAPGTAILSVVRMAFGANPDSAPGTWVWTDVTKWFRGTAVITKGKLNQAASADASRLVGITLDNNDGRFSPDNVMSPLWPYIVPNVPVQLSITGFGDPLVAPYERITTFVDGWSIQPNAGLVDVIVPINGSGRLKRIVKNNKPTRSTMYRLITRTAPTFYWPMEGGSTVATSASYVAGVPNLSVLAGTPTFGAAGGDGSVAAVALTTTQGLGVGLRSSVSTSMRLAFAVKATEPTGGTVLPIVSWTTTTGLYFDVALDNTGLIYVDGSISIVGGGPNASLPADFYDGKFHLVFVDLAESGGNVTGTLTVGGVFHNMGILVIGTTLGALASIRVNPQAVYGTGGVAMSVCHLAAWTPYVSAVTLDAGAAIGYAAETPSARLIRFAGELGIAVTTSGTSTQLMGPQPYDTPGNIIQQIPDTDGGLLHDGGPSGNLDFAPLSTRYNATPALTLYYGGSQLGDGLGGSRDDVGLYNDTVASRPGGISAESIDAASILAVGENDRALTANPYLDTQLNAIASWSTHVGSFPATRFPVVSIDLRRSPELAQTILATDLPGSRIVIKGLPAKWYGYNDVDLFVEGLTETIDAVTWRIDLVCSAGGPYQVAQLGSATNSHLDPANCVLAGGGWNGSAASFTTTTTGGPLLSTNAGDYPVDFNLAGQRVTVSSVTGASNPQTVNVSAASVNGVVKNHPAGEAVSLWQPFYLAL